MINDLRERLLHRRPFVPPLENSGSSYGFNTHFLTQVLDYWQNKYQFKDREQFFNKYPQFKTNVQGLDIHFMRVRPEVDANVTVSIQTHIYNSFRQAKKLPITKLAK